MRPNIYTRARLISKSRRSEVSAGPKEPVRIRVIPLRSEDRGGQSSKAGEAGHHGIRWQADAGFRRLVQAGGMTARRAALAQGPKLRRVTTPGLVDLRKDAVFRAAFVPGASPLADAGKRRTRLPEQAENQ